MNIYNAFINIAFININNAFINIYNAFLVSRRIKIIRMETRQFSPKDITNKY